MIRLAEGPALRDRFTRMDTRGSLHKRDGDRRVPRGFTVPLSKVRLRKPEAAGARDGLDRVDGARPLPGVAAGAGGGRGRWRPGPVAAGAGSGRGR
jgi:hypothetical protein